MLHLGVKGAKRDLEDREDRAETFQTVDRVDKDDRLSHVLRQKVVQVAVLFFFETEELGFLESRGRDLRVCEIDDVSVPLKVDLLQKHVCVFVSITQRLVCLVHL